MTSDNGEEDLLKDIDESMIMREVELVELDSLAFAKICQHCQGTAVQGQSTGQLVGLEEDGILKISNSFAIPSDASTDGFKFTLSMLRSFREVNIDHEAVGWYTSVSAGSIYTQYIIETQFNFQQNIAQSVLLAFDLSKDSAGESCVRAYRLSNAFMAMYKERKITAHNLSSTGLKSQDIFVQIPIKITQSGYAKAFMRAFTAKASGTDSKFDALKLEDTSVLERNIEDVGKAMDAFSQEQYKWTRYQNQVTRQQQLIQHHTYKRRVENQKRIAAGEEPLPEEDVPSMFRTIHEPSKLEGLLLQAQISEYCSQIGGAAETRHAQLTVCKNLQ